MNIDFKQKILFKPLVYLRRSAYLSLGLVDSLASKDSRRLIILNYHSFSNDSWLHSVSLDQLDQQLTFLKRNYNIIGLDQVHQVVSGKLKIKKTSFAITVDDGYKDILGAVPVFQKHKIKPAVFVLASRLNYNHDQLGSDKPLLNRNGILKLKKLNWIIGSHSLTHSSFDSLSEVELEREILGSKIALERDLGFRIKYLAYPRGIYNSGVLKIVKKSKYLLALSMDDGLIDKETNPFYVPRIGVNGSHSLKEFESMIQPSSIRLRKQIKRTFARYLFR